MPEEETLAKERFPKLRRFINSHLLLLNTFLLASRSRNGFASMLAIFRILAALVVLVRFYVAGHPEQMTRSPFWWLYLGMALLLLIPMAWRLRVQERIEFQALVLAAETLAIYYFIFQTNDVGSELYLLLLIPMVAAATFLPRLPAVLTSLGVVGIYLAVLFLMPHDSHLMRVLMLWFGHSFFLLAAIWLYRLQRKLPQAEEGEIISPSRARADLEKLLADLSKTIPYDTASVQMLYQNQLQIVACLGFPNPDEICQIGFPVVDDRYPNGRVISTRQPLIVDSADYPSFSQHQYHAGHIRSWIGVPLISPSNGECFGMISIDSTQAGAYKRADAVRAGWFARKASSYLIEAALGPAALTQATKRMNLHRMLRYWAVLLSRKNTLWQDDLQAAQELVHIGKQIFHVEDCSIYFTRHKYNAQRDEMDRVLHLVASSAIPPEHFTQREIRVTGHRGDGLTGLAVFRNKLLNFGAAQILNSPYRSSYTDHLQFLFSKASRQIMIMPLRDYRGRAVGALKIENRMERQSENQFTLVEQNIFEVFGMMISLMLENIRQRNYIIRQQQSIHNVRALLHHAARKPLQDVLDLDGQPDQPELRNKLLGEVSNAVEYTKTILDGVLSDSEESLLLENEGLVPAIRRYIVTLEALPTVAKACQRITVDTNNLRDDLPFRIRAAMYNIAREAIVNLVRHSGIENKPDGAALVRVTRDNTLVHLTVQDNGCGFSVDTKMKVARCFGLRDMLMQIETIRKFGGQAELSLQAEPGAGTNLSVQVILPPPVNPVNADFHPDDLQVELDSV